MIRSHFFSFTRKSGVWYWLDVKKVVFVCFFLFYSLYSFSQSVKTIIIDFSNKANNDTTIYQVGRSGDTCGGTNCIVFKVILNPASDQLSLNAGGGPALGSATYQVNCGQTYSLAAPACISGLSIAYVTFCKVGNNKYDYTISTSTAVKGSDDITLRQNCSGTMSVTGLQASSVTWTSIYPGSDGLYNSYLSSSFGVAATTVTPAIGAPAYIDYRVSGSTSSCGNAKADTIRVYTTPPLSVPISPATPAICSGAGVTLTASPSGGNPPYTYLWTGGSTIATTTVTTPGTYTVTVNDNTVGCAAVPASVTVAALPTPVAPTAPGTSICAGTTATVTASAPGGTYKWYNASGTTLLFTGASYTTPVLSTTTSYLVETTVSGCTSPRTTVTVTVTPTPIVPSGTGSTICAGNTATLTATGSGTLNWYAAAAGGSSLQTGGSYTTPVLTNSTTYYVENSVSGCASTRTSVIATVTPIPAAPTAASAVICTGSSVTLTVTAPGGIYTWYTVSSGGSPLQTGTSYTTPIISTNTSYYVETIVSGCTSPRTTVTITVNSTPPDPVVSPVTICTGTAAVLSVSSPLTGVTYDWYTASVGGTLLTTGTSYTTPVLNTNTDYYVQANLAGCSNSGRIMATVTVSAIPPVPTASSPTICAGNTATVTATASGGTLDWFTTASGGSSLQTGSSYTTPVLSASTSYFVQNTVAGCASSRTASNVTVTPIPVAPTAASVVICSGSSASLTATAPGGSYIWYDAASGGTQLQTGAGYSTPVLNTNTSYYVETIVSGCTSTRTTVNVSVSPTPAVPVVGTVAICTGNMASLAINSPVAGASYEWYTAASGGTPESSGISYTTPVLTANAIYYVQARLGACTSNRSIAGVTVNGIPTAPVATSPTICVGTAALLTASGSGTLDWYAASSGGNSLQTGASFSTPVLNTSTTYYVQNTVSTCISSRTPVTATVTAIPIAPTATNAAICIGSNAVLTATAPGGIYDWYNVATGGSSVFTGAGFTTPVLNTSTTYYVQTTISSCASSRTMVTVNTSPIPTVPSFSVATVCAGNTATATITSPVAGVIYQWYDAPSAGNLMTTGTSFTTPVLTDNTNYYVQANFSGCSSSRITTSIPVTQAPAAPFAAPVFVCAGNTAVLTATGPGGTYQWYDAAAAGNLLTTGANLTTPVLTVTTQYYVQTTVAGCTGLRSAVTVNVNPAPAVPTVLGNTICAGNSSSLTATAPGGTYQWFDAASGGNLLFTGPNFITPLLNSNINYYIQSTIAGCTGPRTMVTVSVMPIPSAPTATNTSVCAGSAASLPASAPGGTYQWYDAASGGNLLFTGGVYTTPVLNNTTVYYVQSTIGACTGQRTGVTVTVNPIPATPTSAGGSICAGNSLTLAASGSGGSYQWYDNMVSGNLLANGSSFTTPVLTATSVYYVQSTLAGCTGNRTTVTATILPILQPAFNYSSGTFCITGSNPTPAIVAGNGGTFSATPAGLVFINTTTGQINVAASALGTYTIQFLTAGPCVYSSSAKVTITNSPDASFVYNGPYCPQQLTALPTFSGAASAGLFSSGTAGLVFMSSSTGEIDLQKSIPGTYTLTNNIVASSGCAAATASNTVTVLSMPLANAGADQTVCVANPVSLNGSISGTATRATWSGGSGSFTNASQLITQYQPAIGESLVKLYLTTDDPSGPCVAAVDSLIININPSPAAPAVQNAAVCTGNSATLIATSPGGMYEWFSAASGGTTITIGNTFTSDALSASSTYYVQSTINSCTGPRTAVTITVASRPVITSPLTGEVCSSNPFTYLITSDLPGTNYTWARSVVTGIINPASSGQTDSVFTEVLNNTSTNIVPVTYSIIPSNKGCEGDPFFYTASVKPTPAVPAISNSIPVCAGTPLTLFTNAVVGGSYQWTGPNGFSSTQQNPVVTNITTASAGIYQLLISVNKCNSSPASKNIAPVIAAPAAASNSPLCEQSTLRLTAGGLNGATYSWKGPSGFSSSIQNPLLPSINVSNAGVYYVTASIAGCTGLTDSVTVNINVPPGTPAIASNSPVCNKDSITLKTLSASPNSNFQWSGPAGFRSVSPSPLISNAQKTNEGLYNLTVSAPGCAITSASSLSVLVNQRPQILTINNNSPLCEGDALLLSATSQAGADFFWNTASGFSSSLQNPKLSNITKTNEDTYRVVASLNGCLSDTAITKVTIVKASVANAGNSSTLCANNAQVTLSGTITGEDTQTGKWSSDGSGSFLSGTNQLANIYVPSAADTAKRKLTLTLQTTNNKVCPVNTSGTVVNIIPAPRVNAGIDSLVCANDSLINLSGQVLNAISGVWISSGTGNFQNSSSLNRTYVPSRSDIQKGAVRFYLVSTGNGNCLAVSDTVQIIIQPVPFVDAGNDLTIFENETIQLKPQVKDGLQFLWTPSFNLSSDTVANPILTGKVNQEYKIRVTGTGSCVAEDQVFVRVLKAFIIPNIFTPNGDNIHDTWEIPELANYPGAIVEIFTRSGARIYSAVGYEKPWDGTFNGKPVPVATYYYIIKPNFRNLIFSGSVTIVR